MQLLPQSLRVATRFTLMAARQTFVGVSAKYLSTIIVQRCDFDEAALGSAIPMEASAVEQEDSGSLGQRGVGLGLGEPSFRIAHSLCKIRIAVLLAIQILRKAICCEVHRGIPGRNRSKNS